MRSLNEINTKFLADEKKLDFYGTIGADGRVHITMLNSLLKLDDQTLVWGQFCQGCSKKNQQLNHQVGFLMLTPDSQILTGNADWLESKTSGPEFDMYNNIPRYRYNSYFGYSPVHYLKINHLDEQYLLDTPAYAGALARTEALRPEIHPGTCPEAVSRYTRRYFEEPTSFKVLGFRGADGYPNLLPLNQGVLTAANRVVFVPEPHHDILTGLPSGTEVAVYAVTLNKLASVLVKGPLIWEKVAGEQVGIVDIDQVYNPMMPKSGYIFPQPKLERTRVYEDVVFEYNV